MKLKKIPSKGFTLIELAVALTIVALVIGGLAVPIGKRIAEQQYIDTQVNVDKAIEALVGYAILNRRLPCPDISTAATDNRDGFEDTTLTSGSISGCGVGVGTYANATFASGASWGDLPWQTLGISPPYNVDAWNNRLRYAVFTPLVTQAGSVAVCSGGIGFANLSCTTFLDDSAAPSGQLDIRCVNPATTTLPGTAPLGCLPGTTPAYSVATNAVFIVYSMGANNLGATSIVDLGTAAIYAFTTGSTGTAARFPDEAVNAPELDATNANRRMFVTRARTDAASSSGQFDDLLSFVSSNTLAAKLSSAGVWP